MKKDNKLQLIDPATINSKDHANIQTAGVVTVPREYTEQELEYLQIRKDLELEAIQKLDKSQITPRKECWFIMDSKWLNKWTAFVQSVGPPRPIAPLPGSPAAVAGTEPDIEGEEPGPVTSRDLFDPQTGKLHLGLQPNLDYRGVTPMVYYTLVELYGKHVHHESAPELMRYVCDIYAIPVTQVDLLQIRYSHQTKAKANVNRLRTQWTPPPEEEVDESIHRPFFCGLTPAHIEAFIYWFVFNIIGTFLTYCCRCCRNRRGEDGTAGKNKEMTRKQSGRSEISYRNYQPLDNRKHGSEDPGDAEMVDLEAGGYSNGAGYDNTNGNVAMKNKIPAGVRTGAKKVNSSRGSGRYTFNEDEDDDRIGNAETSHTVANPLVQSLKNTFR